MRGTRRNGSPFKARASVSAMYILLYIFLNNMFHNFSQLPKVGTDTVLSTRACASESRGSGVRQPHIAETTAECIHKNVKEKGVYFCCGINDRKNYDFFDLCRYFIGLCQNYRFL